MTWSKVLRWIIGAQEPLPQPADPAFHQDRKRFEREIAQVDRVNEFLIAKAVARGRITEEQAAAIRLTHPANEALKLPDLEYEDRPDAIQSERNRPDMGAGRGGGGSG